MRNKLILFLMLALFGSASFLRADEVTIGDPTSTTTNSYLPTYSLYEYSFSQQIYTADEIGMSGTINDVTLWLKNNSSYARNFNIYMKETSEVTFADGTAWVSMTDADLVATGTLANGISAPVATTFTLSAPFSYSGTGNLVICFQDVTGEWSSGAASVVMTGNGYQAMYAYRDGTVYDPTTPGVSGTRLESKSVVSLNITPAGGQGGGGELVEVTIGDPTSTDVSSYIPGYSLYDYAISQQIYTADEIGVAGTINTLTVWLKNTSSYARNINVYMKEVEATEFASNTAWESFAAADMVASFTMPNENADPIEVALALNTPFNYSGNGSLAICFQDVTGQWSSGLGGVVMDANGNQAIYAYRDGTVYDPSNPGVNGTLLAKKNVIKLAIETSTPVPPTEGVSITPNPVALGDRPTNGWMEPVLMRIHNGLENTLTMTGNMSNTAGVNVFEMSEEIDNVVLEAEEDFAVAIDVNQSAPVGEYAEQFTLFYIENSRDITLVPVTATLYTPDFPDMVEYAGTVSFTSDVYEDTPDPTVLHANYNLFGMTQKKTDAVYKMYLANDYHIHATGGDDFIAFYKYNWNTEDPLQLTAAIEPTVIGTSGIINDEILLKGYYYLVVASENITDIHIDRTEIPAPGEITYIDPSPANGATEVSAPVTLKWEGGINATEYQVLFGTSPTNLAVAKDWTMIDEDYGTYIVSSLQSNTQYFWQIKVRNSKGTVTGDRWGFTSTLTTPNTVTATPNQIFTDGSTLIKWKHSSGTMGDLPEMQIGSGNGTSSYFPTYNLYNYSLTEQIYTAEELGGEAGYINSISFYPIGGITRNLKVYMANTDKASFTGGSDWVAMTADNLVYEGNVTMVANTWVTINFDEPFEYEGENIIIAVTDHTGTWTSSVQYSTFAATGQSINIYQDSAPYSALAPSGSGTVRDDKNQIIINKDDRGLTANRDFLYYNVYVDGVKNNTQPITEKQYLLSNLEYNMNPGHQVGVTAVYNEGESAEAQVTVYVSGYSTFTGHVNERISGAPVAGVNVKFNGTDEFGNNVAYEGTTDATGKYTINNVKVGQYVGVATLEGMEPAYATDETAAAQTLVYGTTSTVDFIIHEVYVPVRSVVAEEMDSELARVRWSLIEDIPVPNPGGNTPGGGSASSFTEGFESGMPADWSVIDGNNDGWTWCLTSAIPSTWTYYASLSLDWYRTGTNAICSGSYINGVGALTPNEYLVMGQQNLVNGSTLSFWAAATDASYPADHFGVFVSDDATNWTSVQEWTLTGKGTRNGGRESRDGNGSKIGTWYNYSVDLSAYAGQKYIAIRHFNCTDQYIMCVDDIELSTAKNTRDVEVYKVYRAPILTEDGEPLNVADIEDVTPYYIASVAGPDTLYADFDWANMEPGLYQYGVAANYPIPAKGGNRSSELTVCDGSATNSYVPVYGFYADAYLKSEMVYPAEVLADMNNGTISSMKFYSSTASASWGAANFQVFMTEVDNATLSSFVGTADATIVYEGALSIVGNEMLVEFTTPYTYHGGNLLVGVYNTVTGSYVSCTWLGESATGASIQGYSYSGLSSITPTQRDFLPKATFTYAGGGAGGNDNPETAVVWSNVLPKDIETTVILNAQVPDASPEGVTVLFNNTFENYTFMVELDETGTDTITDFRKGNYTVTFDLAGYTSNVVGAEYSIWDVTEITAVFQEIFKPVDVISASRSGYVNWNDVLPADTRVAEYYVVRLDGAQYAETTDNFIQIDQDLLTVGQTYAVGVAVMYTSGISTWANTTFTYADCSAAAHQVEGLEATNEPGNTNVVLAWNGATPTPPTPPTPPTGGWTEGFESGMPSGWNVVDGNNDGWTWCLTSAIPTTWTYYASVTLDWYRTGTNAICSGSYINGVGALTPDEYLVMGQQSIVNGSTLTFWAAAADASYPADHFGVFVSDNGTSGWTSVQEWTLTGKGTENGGRESRDGKGAKLGSWHQFTADLSAFAGTSKYIAIRHFNCNDQYIMVVDDIEFTGAKRGGNLAAAGVGFGAANNALTDDGNWYYYDNGINEDAIGTGGGNFWWAIMLPAGSYDGNRLTKVAAYDYMAMTGTASIYQGGTSAPAGTALGTINVTMTGSNDFVEYEFAEAIELDPEQNVWVVFYNGSGATYPAAVCNNTGDANGRWVSLDGSTWEDLAGYGLDYTFMLRAYIESGSGPAPTALQPNKYNIFVDGELVGATASNTFTYDATDFAEHEYIVIWVDGDLLESCIVPDENLIYYAAAPLGIAESMVNSTLYPNPTDGDIRINANNMVRISIVNTLGQVVYDKAVNGNEAIINMAQFGNGVYMVNIATENGSSVKRVIVNK